MGDNKDSVPTDGENVHLNEPVSEPADPVDNAERGELLGDKTKSATANGEPANVQPLVHEIIDPSEVPWWTSCRLTLALVGFLGFVNLYALRVNMSVAIVCMVNQTAIKAQSTDTWTNQSEGVDDTCGAQAENNTAANLDGPFVWDKELQGIILGSFFWGYILTPIPGGWLAARYGGKRVLGLGMLATAIATLLTPIGAQQSPYLLMALRFIKGLGEGVVFPSMHTLWSQWAPPLERSKLIGFTYAGAQIGNVITMPLSGMLCEKGFAGGWPSIFYVLGTFCLLWFILWMSLVADRPEIHPRITDIERRYIEHEVGHYDHSPKMRTPWLEFARSMPVWAIVVGMTCANWGTYTLLTNIPAYMREVLKFDISSNGLFSAIPYLVLWAVIALSGIIADMMSARDIPIKVVRKIMYSFGTLMPAVFLIATGYITCQNAYVAVAVLTLAVGSSGCQFPSVFINHVDIAPPFAGILFGISNVAGTLPGILTPLAVGKITVDQTQQQWQIVFYLAASIYVLGAIFFGIFADGELQDWVKPYIHEDEEVGAIHASTENKHKIISKKRKKVVRKRSVSDLRNDIATLYHGHHA